MCATEGGSGSEVGAEIHSRKTLVNSPTHDNNKIVHANWNEKAKEASYSMLVNTF